MPSPFLGMDPFLEAENLWPWFQHQLAIVLPADYAGVPSAAGHGHRAAGAAAHSVVPSHLAPVGG